MPGAAHAQLRDAPNGSDGLMLLSCLLANHGARSRRGEDFAIAAAGMAKQKVIRGWGVARYRKATSTLLDERLISMTHRGGAHRGDPHRFRFSGVLSRLNEPGRVVPEESM